MLPISHPAAIILAAGASHRMGRPKISLLLKGGTFLGRLVSLFHQVGCRQVVAVISDESDQIGTDVRDVELLRNPHPEEGPLSSVKLALRILPPRCPGYFLHPVDHPAIAKETLRRLLQTWEGHPGRAVKPVCEGRGGHPLLMGRDWTDRIRNLPMTSNLRDLLRSHADDVMAVPVKDPGILLNINNPEEYQHLLDLYPEI